MICSKCGIDRKPTEFHSNGRGGLRTDCKFCRSNKHIRRQLVENHSGLDKSISRSMYRSLKRQRDGFIWERTIGITFFELKEHLEKQFDDIMKWENYGSYWVIDKIIPTAYYIYRDRINNEFKKAWSLKNFRPYPKHLHLKRKEKIVWELIDYYNLYDILPIGLLGDNLWTKRNL